MNLSCALCIVPSLATDPLNKEGSQVLVQRSWKRLLAPQQVCEWSVLVMILLNVGCIHQYWWLPSDCSAAIWCVYTYRGDRKEVEALVKRECLMFDVCKFSLWSS